MNNTHIKSALLVMAVLVAGSAYAHDPSEHADKAEKPKCEAMASMDQSALDADDPIAQAMLKKCQAAHTDEGQDEQHEPQDTSDHHQPAADHG